MIAPGPIEIGLLVLAVALAVALALAAAVVRSGRAEARQLLVGARNGALVALVLLVAAATIVTLLTVGRPFLFGATLTLEGALVLGLLLALPLAGGYLLAGLLVMLIGAALGRGGRWLTREAWIVAPGVALLIVAALGMAASMAERADRPVTRLGGVNLVVEGEQLGRLETAGDAQCSLEGEVLVVLSGTGEGATLTTTDGRPASVQFSLVGDQPRLLALGVGAHKANSDRSILARQAVDPGSTRASGTVRFEGLLPFDERAEPLATQQWSGSLHWECPF